jgi:hypothetical protein
MGIFGPTKKGGGFDMRYKSNQGGMMGKVGRGVSGLFASSLANSSNSKNNQMSDNNDMFMAMHVEKERQESQKITEVKNIVSNTIFDTDDLNDISVKLDNLISNARIGLGIGVPLFTSAAKIRTGLAKLKYLGAFELSVHFESEYRLLKRLGTFSTIMKVLKFVGTIILIGFLFFLIFFLAFASKNF